MSPQKPLTIMLSLVFFYRSHIGQQVRICTYIFSWYIGAIGAVGDIIGGESGLKGNPLQSPLDVLSLVKEWGFLLQVHAIVPIRQVTPMVISLLEVGSQAHISVVLDIVGMV